MQLAAHLQITCDSVQQYHRLAAVEHNTLIINVIKSYLWLNSAKDNPLFYYQSNDYTIQTQNDATLSPFT